MPGIREGIEQKAWDEARRYIPIVASAVDKLSGQSIASSLVGGR